VQLEYAALDAAVLVHIFHHIRGHSQPATAPEGHDKIEWKSYIVSTASLLFLSSLIFAEDLCVHSSEIVAGIGFLLFELLYMLD
jgi:hypothetical protein